MEYFISAILGALLMRLILFLLFRLDLLRKKLIKVANQKTDHFITGIKQTIPMAGAVLQGDLEKKLKSQACDEVISSVPEIEKIVAVPSMMIGALIGFLSSVVTVWL